METLNQTHNIEVIQNRCNHLTKPIMNNQR